MDLSPKQMIFVTEYMKDRNATQAAIRAGYSESTARQQGSRLLSNVNIQEYLRKQEVNIQRDLREMFTESAVDAYRVLKEIMLTGENEKNRLAAARDLLDRAGYKPVDKVMADVNSEGTLEVIIQTPDVNVNGWGEK